MPSQGIFQLETNQGAGNDTWQSDYRVGSTIQEETAEAHSRHLWWKMGGQALKLHRNLVCPLTAVLVGQEYSHRAKKRTNLYKSCANILIQENLNSKCE